MKENSLNCEFCRNNSRIVDIHEECGLVCNAMIGLICAVFTGSRPVVIVSIKAYAVGDIARVPKK